MLYQVIDNFLDDVSFLAIKNDIYGGNFPWFKSDGVVIEQAQAGIDPTWCWQLYHMFYCFSAPYSGKFSILEPLINKLNPSAIMKIKGNLVPRADKIIEHGLHIDIPGFKGKTAVYYINSNNGFTVFDDGSKVESLANRMVIFDSTIKHTGTTCTDAANRCVINFNYYEWNFE